ncbi:ATP-binding cassette domain-containing protein [Lysinibacillus sphaericus]|uniref:ATP-binding cassette domain-containing protein n=1 Tax=Lysinibacillus sphaericus TaxID=1421 RepID=UPI003D023351
MLSIDGLSVSLNGRQLINNVTFTVPKGRITSIIGESGSGKSMTVSAILGLLPVHAQASGAISLNDKNLVEMSPKDKVELRKMHFFTIFQDAANSFSPSTKMKHQLFIFTGHKKGHTKMVFFQKMRLILQDLDLTEDIMERYPFELSGGMLQRCMIACALYTEPTLLIADEPTSALDMLIQKDFIELLKKLNDEKGTTILLITHDLDIAVSAAHSVVVMKKGEVVEKGLVTDIFEMPKNSYTKLLLENHF